MPAPGEISTIIGYNIPANTSQALRDAAIDKVESELDALVSGATRDGWLNQTYSGGTARSDLRAHGNDEVNAGNSALTMDTSTSGDDSYCCVGSDCVCYTIGDLLENGSPVDVDAKDSMSNTITVRLIVMVAYGLT